VLADVGRGAGPACPVAGPQCETADAECTAADRPERPEEKRNGRYRHGRYAIAGRTMMAEMHSVRRALTASLKTLIAPSS
jgi:hypothetical protein